MYIKLPIPIRNAVLSLIGLDIITDSTKEQQDELVCGFDSSVNVKMLKTVEKEWIDRYIIN